VFKMLREAGLLSKAGEIMPAVLSERVAAVLSARSPSDLRFFPTGTATDAYRWVLTLFRERGTSGTGR
jgi:hypothetical protein